jgi:Right handed beta helix region
VAVVLVSRSAPGQTYEIHPGDDLFATIGSLDAGDEVVVHAGTYRSPGYFAARWTGTTDAPIVVRGAKGERRPVLVGRAPQDIIGLDGSHFTLSHVELRGGDDALRLGNVDHATLEDFEIHGVDDVGISCNVPGHVCDGVTIRDSDIHDTGRRYFGEGLYLGCHDAGCAFRNGLVEDNVVHDMGGSQGDGIEIKAGSYNNTVRDNTLYRTRFPGITVFGYDAPVGKPNRVERNSVWRTRHDGIRVVGRGIVSDNVVFEAAFNPIAAIPSHGGAPTLARNATEDG